MTTASQLPSIHDAETEVPPIAESPKAKTPKSKPSSQPIPPAPPELQVPTVLDDIAAEEIEHIKEAEQLLQEIIDADRQPNHAELLFFHRRQMWDKSDVTRELFRLRQVAIHQAVAGDSHDREATRSEATKASELLDTEAPKLQAKIENLQKQLTALEQDARNLDRRTREQEAAVERLRELIPSGLLSKYQHESARLYSGIGPGGQLGELKREQERIECALAPSKYAHTLDYFRALESLFPEAVSEQQDGHRAWPVYSPEWSTIERQLTERQAVLEIEIVEQQAIYDGEIAGIAHLRDYYTR